MPQHNCRPIKNAVTGKGYPSIASAIEQTGTPRNTIYYWLTKSLSGKQADWEYLERDPV